ncbi:MAG: SMP-30/gluconolactonase/LRE family protein [Myxococcota bacterium]
MKLETLLDGLVFGEGPRWHEGRLWLSDMHAQTVLTVDLDGKREDVLRVEGKPSGLGWLPDGRLLVVSMTDRRLLRREPDGSLVTHADLTALTGGDCNDMVVDAAGRAYVGNFGFDFNQGEKPQTTCIVRVDPDGTAQVAATGLRFPNGSVVTPDGRTLVVGESFGSCLTAFTIGEDGSLSARREWAKLEGATPDGICLDAENAIWVASPMSNELLRVREGGAVTDRIPTGRQAIACMLGGPDRRTLFALTAETIRPEEALAARSARVEITRVEVPGAGHP